MQSYEAGSVFVDRYEIQEVLGQGPVGTTYLAFDREVEIEVVLKILAKELFASEGGRQDFVATMSAVGELSHSNLRKFYEVETQDDLVFYTGRYHEGDTLRQVLQSRKNFTHLEVEPILARICEALEFASSHFAHGGIRPENILMLPHSVKVTDLGLAASLSVGTYTATLKKGTASRYLAPEVRQGLALTPQADVYSLGVLFYEMLTGDPYEGENTPSLLSKNPVLPPAFDEILQIALSKEPENRYAKTIEFSDDIASVIDTGKVIPREGVHTKDETVAVATPPVLPSFETSEETLSASGDELSKEMPIASEASEALEVSQTESKSEEEAFVVEDVVTDVVVDTSLTPSEEIATASAEEELIDEDETIETAEQDDVTIEQPSVAKTTLSEEDSSLEQTDEKDTKIAAKTAVMAAAAAHAEEDLFADALQKSKEEQVVTDSAKTSSAFVSTPHDVPSSPSQQSAKKGEGAAVVPVVTSTALAHASELPPTSSSQPQAALVVPSWFAGVATGAILLLAFVIIYLLLQPPTPSLETSQTYTYTPEKTQNGNTALAAVNPSQTNGTPTVSPPMSTNVENVGNQAPISTPTSEATTLAAINEPEVTKPAITTPKETGQNSGNIVKNVPKNSGDTGSNAVVASTPTPAKGKCPRGMVKLKYGPDKTEYCIDRYEFPNAKGAMPKTGVDYNAAEASCSAKGKRLCRSQEWGRACGGRYPYGAEFDAEVCNTQDAEGNQRSVVASGSFAKCKASGVSDMSGNVEEWIQGNVKRGGSGKSSATFATCNKTSRGGASGFTGFRCCADPQ